METIPFWAHGPRVVVPSRDHGGPIVLKPFDMDSWHQKTPINFLSTKFNEI